MEKGNSYLVTKNIAQIGIFATILVICAQIIIPMPFGVPLTMQTFGILLAGIILGAKKGFIAVLVYLLLGAIGLPVFQGFSGGVAPFAGPTGGFLLSFPLMPIIVGFGMRMGRKVKNSISKHFLLVVVLFVAVFVNLFTGLLFFSINMSTNLTQAFQVTVLPFVFVEIIKIAGASILGTSVRAALLKGNIIYEI